jgi:hypothetical protein
LQAVLLDDSRRDPRRGQGRGFLPHHLTRLRWLPLSSMGAARQGGRFNRPGQEALYLARDAATALAEDKQDNPWLRPGTICTFFVQGLSGRLQGRL